MADDPAPVRRDDISVRPEETHEPDRRKLPERDRSTSAAREVNTRSEQEHTFATYPPEVRAHMHHDDTLARLQYLGKVRPGADAAETAQSAGDNDPAIRPAAAHQPEQNTPSTAPATNDDVESRSAKDDDHSNPAEEPSTQDSGSPVSGTASTEREIERPIAEPQRSVESPRVDIPSGRSDVQTTSLDANSARQDPFASYSPDLRAHMVHDDTLARLQYLSAPRRQPDVPADTENESATTRVVGSDDRGGRVHEFVEEAEPDEMAQYRRIRAADDVDAVADHSGYPREVVDEVKQHLFVRRHDVAVGPDRVEHGYFTPDRRYGELWEKVASGADLDSVQQMQFWSFLAHEYVEAKLMEAGLPYRSSDPQAFDDDGSPDVSPRFPSAHNTAPLSMRSATTDLLKLWDTRLGIPRGDLRVAADLSNLDEVVRLAKEGLGL
ncbi:hypothetical protein EV651_1202 [Kribbella sp. VKM Ac-2571]|uniref:hypothetical protein n=1 Tax=Kribbella sp. VKM Ac-2571 TaxID=2512222 RepID=UPI00105B6142|nr:hypothetical protein [Kribbella sp. VKM Ac-2571]TDO50318.1 hypothetical protein EV651_1202 [Kribbella sp. VKM Ac-2571]